MRDGLVDDLVEAATDDVGHEVAAHVLLAHPRDDVGRGPVTPQADLDEAVAGHRAGLDEAAHGRAVAVELAPLVLTGVGVRVEVDERDLAEAEDARDPGRVGKGDRVVTAEHQRNGAG